MLTSEQAKLNQEKYGFNELIEGKKKSVFQIFLEQFKDFLVIILIISAIVSGFLGDAESAIVIFVVITMNAILGTVQTVKAEQSLNSLKQLSAPEAKVMRDGLVIQIPSREVTIGDRVIIEAGDCIPADGKLVECASLKVDESALTGESLSVEKSLDEVPEGAALGDQTNRVFSGSFATYGRASYEVTEIGMNTEVGKIASLLKNASEKKTPLQMNLDDFGKKLSIIILIFCGILFGINVFRGGSAVDAFLFAVALAVAAIPEALSSIVTIVLSFGTQKMAKEHAIIRKLQAVEGLGSVSVICSDKTGTLTQNKMTVTDVYVGGECLKPEEMDITEQIHRYFLYTAILNNDSSINGSKDIGDPTETALLNMSRKAGLSAVGVSEEDIRSMMPRMDELPFDSDRKLMSTKYRIHGVPTVLTKGALDVLLDRIVNIYTKDGIRPITEADKEEIVAQNQKFSENGLRVLAFAHKESDETETLSLDNETGFTFTGLVAMIDPPREETIQAVADAIGAGIKPVMITGDHKVTATAIAKQIGIFKDGDMALTGQELDAMSDEELAEKLEHISVYARVSPENKIRIVDAWQKKGHIAAMTGDGVNDAPALKKADIGVAMGITGTEVSKDAAAMILADDNFATIIKAVLNGRNVYRNILNAIQFLLSGNMAAILAVLYCSVMALDSPFEPVHLLFINLLTDSLPALAIGMEPTDKTLLKNKPRDPKTGILTKEFSLRLVFYGILIAIVTMTGYYIGLDTNAMTASTMAFATLTLARLFHGFTCRSDRPIAKIGLTSNKWSLAAFGVGVFLLAVVLLVPFMQKLFVVTSLTGVQLATICGLAFLPTLVIQIVKMVKEFMKKK